MVSLNIAAYGFGLVEEGELKVQMLNKPQMLIEVQMLNSALLPLFRQTLVVRSFISSFCYSLRSLESINEKISVLFVNLINGLLPVSFDISTPSEYGVNDKTF